MTTRTLVLLLAGIGLFAAPPSRRDRDVTLSHLHATRKQILDAVAPLSDAQFRYKPAPEVWSAAEVVEHLTVVEEGLLQLVKLKLMQAPARAGDPKLAAEVEAKILKAIPDRSQKAQAPQQFRPSGRYKTRAALMDAFRANREQTLAYIRETQDELRDHFADNPGLGTPVDGIGWLLFISAHTERHHGQLVELLARPDFPKR
jgi:uncharacterized damage-inducible protein DinB